MADEPLEIIDTHVHLWNLLHPTLRWSWLAPEAVHPILGDINAIKTVAYEADALWAEARFAGVSSFVHVQAADGGNPVEETAWLTEMAERHDKIPAAIIAHCDLGRADADEVLAGHRASPRFRGIRDFGAEPYLASGTTSARYERSLERLARDGTIFDLDCAWPNMAAASALANRHPNLPVVLEHIGYPRCRDEDYFQAWAKAIRGLATAPNVVCKISGIAMTDRLFTQESLRPWVEVCLDSFGPQRCMVGSNWPVDRLCSSYDVIMGCYRQFTAALSVDERQAILAGNARAVYGL
jgi:predicted TIM-barrel fold metal-dependent hydrolase